MGEIVTVYVESVSPKGDSADAVFDPLSLVTDTQIEFWTSVEAEFVAPGIYLLIGPMSDYKNLRFKSREVVRCEERVIPGSVFGKGVTRRELVRDRIGYFDARAPLALSRLNRKRMANGVAVRPPVEPGADGALWNGARVSGAPRPTVAALCQRELAARFEDHDR